MQRSWSRLLLGFALVAAGVLYRCVATAHGGVLMTFGPHLPALTRIDLLTAPIALWGVGVLAAGRGLGLLRRFGGVLALVMAIALPAVKVADMGEVLFSISSRHGVHTLDLLAFPVLGSALGLLAPWRSPLRAPTWQPFVTTAGAPLATAVPH